MDGEIIVISFLNGRYYSATGFAADLLNALSKGPLSKEDAFAWLEKHRGPPEGTGWNLALDVLWERLLTEGMLSCTEAPSVTDNLSRTSVVKWIFLLTNPFRQIIGWAFDDLVGGALVHAAAVSTPHGAVLIGGPSGVGKSTLVAHCVPGVGGGDGAEVGFMGDDWVGLYRAGTRYVVSPIYRSLKIARDNPLAKGLAWIEAKHETKALCLVDEFPLPPTALAAIVVPTIVPSVGVSVKGISPMQAVQRIAPSTLLQSGNLSPGVLETICDAAEDTPCYSLEVGTGAALAPWIFAGLAERKWT
jgi:hypothetical protein